MLAVFFQKTRIGRALRAVADDHQAALAVGIPLQHIWAIVWAVAGFVALVAGLMWGVRNGVQFALTFVALKALPVLIIGGFESIAGAIVGGLIIGATEKLAEVYIGPYLRRRHRVVVRLRGGAAVPAGAGPKACSARSTSTGSRRRHALPRSRASSNRPTPKTSRSSRSARTASRSGLLMAVAFVVVPLIGNQYWLGAIITPFLILALATLGLNILTGYAGQLSLGTAAFMAVGAFMAYNFMLRMPWLGVIPSFILAGLCAAAVGIVFGLPSLRIKGFYLAVATLACQFFVLWALQRFGWFTNYSTSGVVTAQRMEIFGFAFDTPATQVPADAFGRRR